MPMLNLTPDELLSTTRAVRRRLDLRRPVEREVLEECLKLAQQAPTASNQQSWHFVVVTDAGKRAALAEIYRRGAERSYAARFASLADATAASNPHARLYASALYLVEHLREVPVHVVPCIEGRTDGLLSARQAPRWGTIDPATWSFMLAARSRSLGTCWTTFHLAFEAEAAEILGIPYAEVMQTALIPVTYTLGTDFKPAKRKPLDTMIHWDAW